LIHLAKLSHQTILFNLGLGSSCFILLYKALHAQLITTESEDLPSFANCFSSVSEEHHQDDVSQTANKAQGGYSWLRYGGLSLHTFSTTIYTSGTL